MTAAVKPPSRASAPAKVMLFGEYAVLEGHRSLALCLDRRIVCTATVGGERLVVEAPGVFEPAVDLPAGVLRDATCPDPRLRLLWPILRAHVHGGVRLVFEAGFPETWGLGSSSASTLAAAGALAGAGAERFAEVRDAQRALQGAASGYDVATQVLGGAVVYRDGDEAEMARIEPGADFNWLLAWTGRKARTGGLIRSVRERHPVGSEIYGEIGALAERGIAAFRSGDRRMLGRLLNEGHDILARLGAVPDELGAIVAALHADPDVLGARMTGAGGGDSVLILADDPRCAASAAEQHGLRVLDLAPEREGLRLEGTR